MKKKIYLSKKGNKFVFEGKRKGKTIYIYTINNDYESFLHDLTKSSFFAPEKSVKINTIIQSLDSIDSKSRKRHSKIRTINIIRNPENNDKLDDEDEVDEDYDLDDDLKELSSRVEVEDEE